MKFSMCIVTLVSSEGPKQIEAVILLSICCIAMFLFFVIMSQFHSCGPVHIFMPVNS
jgi:hypothetical protein